jgi:hypothetical protein
MKAWKAVSLTLLLVVIVAAGFGETPISRGLSTRGRPRGLRNGQRQQRANSPFPRNIIGFKASSRPRRKMLSVCARTQSSAQDSLSKNR